MLKRSSKSLAAVLTSGGFRERWNIELVADISPWTNNSCCSDGTFRRAIGVRRKLPCTWEPQILYEYPENVWTQGLSC